MELELSLILVLLPLLVMSIKDGSIPLNSSLTSSQAQQFSNSWRSPSGDFAFGFRKIEPNEDFMLSIWFDKIPGKTVAWYVHLDSSVPQGSKVTLTRDQGIVLTNPRGDQIWRSQIDSGVVSYASLNDFGNLVIKDESSDELWSSFAHPADTLLPTQELKTDSVLSSRQSNKNFTKGRFRAHMLEYGNLELNVVNLPTGKYYGAYYSCKTEDPRTGPNSGFRLVYNESGELYISTRNGTNIQIHDGKGIVIPSRDFYHRVVLHFDGVFAQYYHPKTGGSNATWSMVWSKPDDICKALTNGLGSGVCGFNSVCVGENQRVSCKCVQGFSLVDKNNENGDCQPDFDSGFCNRTRNDYSYDFIRLQDVVWESSDYEEYWPYEEENCRVSCLQDCFCAVASFIGSSCRKKKYPLSNGRLDQSLDARAFIKVPKSGISAGDIPFPARNPNGKKQLSQKGLVITGYTLLGASLLLNFIILIAFRSRSHCSLADKKKDSGSAVIKSNLHVFTYKELVEATSDFRDEVGRGAFGIVYKGMIRTGDNNTVLVAVKRLDRVAQEGDKEFKNEVNVIGQTHHKNLVKLVGFCKEDQNHLLLYEFLPNGTLANFLFGHPKPVWKERTRIALGIARGILYLHEECDTQIIHCDIKPQNVLLDDHFNAKISDFGLAKLLMMNQTHTRTGIRGTKGYIAAEWFRNTPITTKVDVYSYGVLLLETICCKKAVDLKDNVILTYWAYDCFRKDRLVDLIVGDYEATDDMDTFERYVKTAIWCVQEDPTVRPNMGKVIQMLEGVTQVCVPPNPSPYDASY